MEERFEWRRMGSPLEEKLHEYIQSIIEEEDLACISEKISVYFDAWPFKDFSLRCWRELSDKLLSILSIEEKKYFSEGIQLMKISSEDKSLVIAILKLFQRIFGYSKQRHPLDISTQIMRFIYAMDLDIAIESYKVLTFCLNYSIGLDEFSNDHAILFKCLGVDLGEPNGERAFGLSDKAFINIPESLGDGDMFSILKKHSDEYGKGNLVFELRRRMNSTDTDGLNALNTLGTCVFLILAKGEGVFDEVVGRVDSLEIWRLTSGELSENMEFAIMNLLDILIYDEFDFARISRILELNNSHGFFYRRFANGFNEWNFERHMVFLVYSTLVGSQKSKYLKMNILMEVLPRFCECSPDVRYHLLRVIKMHCKESNSKGISEFISKNGVKILTEYLEHAEEYDIDENINLRYAFRILSDIYMDERNRAEVGNFEDSAFLDITVATIKKLCLLDARLVSVCVGILSSFMFDEPLNFPVFMKKGAGIVLRTQLSVEPSMEYVSAFISYIDAFSLNLKFQNKIVEGEYLFKLLVVCREGEFLGSMNGTNKIMSLLNVLIMHHPVFKQDILKFYAHGINYLKALCGTKADGCLTQREYYIEIFNNLFSLIEKMEVYPEREDSVAFFDEIFDLVINPKYSCSIQNLFKGSFSEVYRMIYKEARSSLDKPLEQLILDTKRIVELYKADEGGVVGYWGRNAHTEQKKEVDDLMFSYDNQIALGCILCEDFMELAGNEVKESLFKMMAGLNLAAIRLNGIFLSLCNLEEHRFLSTYRSIRVKLEESTAKEDSRLYVLQSIYLCNLFLLQKMYPGMIEASFDITIEYVEKLVGIMILEGNDSIVLGLRIIERLSTCFKEEHYGAISREEFIRCLLVPHPNSERLGAVVSFFVSQLSSRMSSSPELRYMFLQYLKSVDVKDPIDAREIELGSMIIEGIGKMFGDSSGLSRPLSDIEMNMILDIYEKFYISPLCGRLMIRRIIRSSKFTMRLVKIRAFSSFQYFLMKDEKVYDHGCFIMNRFFEYSDEFIDMASTILLFATVGRCPHKIDIKELGKKISGLITSDVSSSKILFFLIMYLRLIHQLKMPKLYSLGFEKLIPRVKTCDEMMLMRILLTYVVNPDIGSVLNGVNFPSRRIKAKDGDFLKSHDFLIYRDYDLFVEKCLKKSGLVSKSSVCLKHGCHRIHFREGKDESYESDKIETSKFFIRELVLLLDTQDCFGLAIQLLCEIMFNNPFLLYDICRYQVLNTIYEKCIRKVDLSAKQKMIGESHWGVMLFVIGLYSEVLLSKSNSSLEKQPDKEARLPSVCDFLLEKIEDGSKEDFLNASFILIRSLTPLFILRHENEEDTTMEKFRESSIFMGSAGIFEKMIKRIITIDEVDSNYSMCIQHSLDYLGRAFRYCYGDILQDLDDYGDDESHVEYYSLASEDQMFDESSFDSDESYFDDSPFHDLEEDRNTRSDETESSSQSENAVFIKSIENDHEIPTTMYLLNSEYYTVSAECRDEIEVLISKKLYSDLIDKNTNYYDWDGGCIQKDMVCEADRPIVRSKNSESYPNEDSEESYADDKERRIWDFGLVLEEGSEEDLNEGADIQNTLSSRGIEENEDMGSSESDVGSQNGEIPSLDPEVLNSMGQYELKEVLKAYFDERRALSLTYVPLHVSFYDRLSSNVRPVFEEMERVYRESFFYDIRSESTKESDEETIEVKGNLLEMDLLTFEKFIRKSITEKEFPFAKGWKLVDALSKDVKMKKVVFEVSEAMISSLVASKEDSLSSHDAVKFRRTLCLLLSVVKSSLRYYDYFQENPEIIDKIFTLLGRVKLTNDLLRLVTDFSVVFRKDSGLVFGRNADLRSILECFGRMVDSECFNLLEEFINNTADHFCTRFLDVILVEIRRQFSTLSQDITTGFPSDRFLENQKIFLRLWKMLAKIVGKNGKIDRKRDDLLIGLMFDPFWNIFFEKQKYKDSIEDLISVSDVYEAFFILGKVFENRAEAPDNGERCNAFKSLYKNTIETQTNQINLLVDEKPEKFFRNFNRLISHSILTFSNKKKYLSRILCVEGTDKPSSSYRVYVDRNDVLRSSYFQVMAKSPEEFRTRRLEIKLTGEEGLDYGGLTREWLVLLAKDLLDPNFALFEFSTGDKTTTVPCKNSYVNPEHLSYFKFVGRIVAKAIMDGNFINLHLSKFIYKHILGKNCDLQDLESTDPEFYKSLAWIRDNHVDESLGLTFSFDDVNFGIHRTAELIEGGANVFVNDTNKTEYINLATQYRLFNGIELQLSALKSGLFEILGNEALEMFDENELELLICGIPDIDIDDWKSNTLYYGYTESSKTVIWFWKAVKSFNSVNRAKLLQFVTGTSTLPFEGFSHLQGNNEVQKFSIHRVSDRMDSLPTAHTCFNQLVLPEYSSYESLLKYLTLAINECSTGFGFI
ncbi:ubiquitin-protein ligase [Encephalitozoon romaleae SJ-2008]|uniref:HECT-type E3 ubiquitin transferase n=1 Tax=Encephalitozoon romaleae (strain SJ-2008) TaxID=1178016 RepID=I7ATY0_ENCRO|nr:ubiquitin-protein ligase [Encephalitozoon romaleae SJ-2008]AFN83942.1 ubiquitin-protein ligase [Encephalitozoon romaleae SJ-2008]